MPLTVITVKNAPQSLKGDLTKWMQEIATGVYVGNFNTKVRQQLWERVVDTVGHGEATISYSYRNEIGYQFNTINAQRQVVDFDGIPLVLLPNEQDEVIKTKNYGFSDAAKFRRIKKFNSKRALKNKSDYVIIDIETDGLDETENSIIEIAAIKATDTGIHEFNNLIEYSKKLPSNITSLTGITQSLLEREGQPLEIVIDELLNFIGKLPIVGYGVDFDVKFINFQLLKIGYPKLKNRYYDLMKYVKKEKLFLDNYKLQTVLREYGIIELVPHRALLDARLIYQLANKVNFFAK